MPLNRTHCGYYRKEFPRGSLAIAPLDIVIKHKEKWQYLNQNRTSELDPFYLFSSSKTSSIIGFLTSPQSSYKSIAKFFFWHSYGSY